MRCKMGTVVLENQRRKWDIDDFAWRNLKEISGETIGVEDLSLCVDGQEGDWSEFKEIGIPTIVNGTPRGLSARSTPRGTIESIELSGRHMVYSEMNANYNLLSHSKDAIFEWP